MSLAEESCNLLCLLGIENLKLSPETIWTYLLQHHCVDQILEWIKNCYGARKDEESASLYPMITPKMVDSVYRYISPHFSDSILDELAQ